MKDWFSKASISNYKRNLWCLYLTGLLAGAGIVLWNRISPSICPSFRLSILRFVQAFSWKCIVSFFQILAGNSHEDVHGRAWFSGKKILPPNLGKWIKTCWTKNRVFWNLLKNLVINFLVNPFCNEDLYLLYSCIWEKFCFWDLGQNIPSQSGCKIF